MELHEEASCRFDDSVYLDGSKVCLEGYCLVCKDGQWMELQEKKSCHSDDLVYPEGSKVCCEGYCLVCNDGRWVDTTVTKESY